MSIQWLLRFLLVPCAVGLLLLAGCTSDDDPIPPAVTVSELAGTWLSGCQPETGGSGPSAVESRLTAVAITAAGAMTFQDYEWNNSDACDGGPSKFQKNVGTLSTPGGNVLTTFGNAAKVDLTASLSELTLFNPATISQYNTEVAYGITGDGLTTGWVRGVAQNVTNINYEGAASPSTMKTLMMRSGETLFVGDDETAPPGGYPTAIRPEVSRVPDVAVTGAGMLGEWSGTCRQEDNTDYNAQAAVEYITVGATSITVNTAYYLQAYCDQTAVSPATQEVIETMTMDYTMAGSANLLTELGMATGGDLTITAHDITPNTGGAAAALNAANGGSGVYGFTDWAGGALKSVPVDRQYDGSTGSTAMKIAALVRGDRFYVRGGDPWMDIPYQSPSGVGYPLTVGVTPLLRNHDIVTATIADLAGSWYEPCRDFGVGTWKTGAVVVSGSTVTKKGWNYTDTTTCAGPDLADADETFTATVQGIVSTDRGTATELQLDPATGNTLCLLVMRVGNRLYAGEPVDTLGTGTCGPGDYLPDVSDNFSSLETTPVTTLPLATYRGPCRSETTNSWVDYIIFHGNAMSGSAINYSTTDCTGTISTHDRFSGVITFGTTVAVTEGDATKISVLDDTGATMVTIVKWMDDLIWTGDDMGLPPGTYPTQMIPGNDLRRIY